MAGPLLLGALRSTKAVELASTSLFGGHLSREAWRSRDAKGRTDYRTAAPHRRRWRRRVVIVPPPWSRRHSEVRFSDLGSADVDTWVAAPTVHVGARVRLAGGHRAHRLAARALAVEGRVARPRRLESRRSSHPPSGQGRLRSAGPICHQGSHRAEPVPRPRLAVEHHRGPWSRSADLRR